MKLRTTVRSPFARKVRIVADVLGISDQLELADTDYLDPSDPMRKENPLGKMPVLILDDGDTLFDSRVIVEYLNDLAGGNLIPSGQQRWKSARLQALADGIMDAGVLIVYETVFRSEDKQDAGWLSFQKQKMDRAFEAISADLPDPKQVCFGTISLVCALEWIDIRAQTEWRTNQPALATWLEAFLANTPEVANSRPPAL